MPSSHKIISSPSPRKKRVSPSIPIDVPCPPYPSLICRHRQYLKMSVEKGEGDGISREESLLRWGSGNASLPTPPSPPPFLTDRGKEVAAALMFSLPPAFQSSKATFKDGRGREKKTLLPSMSLGPREKRKKNIGFALAKKKLQEERGEGG